MYILYSYYCYTFHNVIKLKHIYGRRKGFYEIKGIGEVDDLLDLPLDSKWYRYKGRIFIFRPKHKIASFVITQNNIYCPLKCFSNKQFYLYYNDTKYTIGNYLIYKWCKFYNKDIRLELLYKDRILDLVRNKFFVKPQYYEI